MAEVLMDAATDPLERLGVALSDPTRRRILLYLATSPAYPSELADVCGTTASNLSNHLACLRGCGFVVAEREGRRIRYEIVSKELAAALRSLAAVTLATPCELS